MARHSAYRSGKSTSGVILFLAFAALSLAGCDLTERIHDTQDQQAETTRQSLENVTNQGSPERYNPLVVTNKIWAGDSAVRIQRGIPLPPKYETPHGFTLVAADPMSLADIANAITTQTGIPVHVEEEKSANGISRLGQQGGNSSFAAAQMMRGGVNVPTVGAGASAATMPVAYEGPLSGLLDHVSGFFSVAWHYDGGTVEISHFETRTFAIEALPGSQKLSSDMTGGATSGGSGGGSSGGGSSGGSSGSSGSSGGSGSGGGGSGGAGGSATSSATMELKADVDVKYWEELKENLNSMLGGEGTVVLSPSLGTITVTTTPETMRTIASYVTQENERMSRQIAIDVEVYTIGLVHGVDFNLSFAAFLRKIGGQPVTGITGAGIPTSIDNLTSALASSNVAILNPTSGHTGVSDIFSALSSFSNSTRQAQFPLVTLNNRPVSVRVGEDQQYVCGYNSNTQATSGSTSSSNVIVTPTVCTLNLGFSIQMAPRLLDDGRILMQYALTSNDLVGTPTLFNSVCGSGATATNCTAASNGVSSGSVELVNTNTRSFSQQSVLRSGSTLVIGGVNEKSLGQNANGVGSPYNFVFGGGVSNDESDTMILIAITPQVIDLPRAEHG
jgi:type IVB pilus formation R64 PilN family outer membrane protein